MAAGPESGLEATRLFEALALCLAEGAGRWPILLVLDDLHWASDSTLQLLHYVTRRLAGAPVLAVGTFRRERRHPLAAFARQVEQERLGQLLALERLPPGAVDDWIRQLSGLGEAVAPLSTWLYEETAGNPFFMVETVTNLFETGQLRLEGGVWAGDLARIGAGGSPLPDRIRAAVQERAARLDREAQEALRLAAVLGREFDFEVFEATWAKGPDAALEMLETLMRHGLIEEGRGEAGRDYAFSHHKIQESLYHGTPRRRRQRLHGQVAAVMEQRYGANLDDAAPELAHHFDQARRLDEALLSKAVSYWRRAGQAAATRFAHAEAATYFSRALDLAPAGEPAARFALLGEREAVWHTQGDRAAQARDVAALEAVARSLGEEAQAEAALRRAAYESVTGNYKPAIKAAQAALSFAEAARAMPPRMRAHYHWGLACFHAGNSAEAGTHFEAALELAEAARLPRVEADALLGLSLVAWKLGRYAEVTEHALRARALFQQIGYTRGEGNVLQQLGIAARYQDQYQAAREHFEAGLRLWRQIGERRGEGFALGNLGVVAMDLAEFQTARGYFEQARRIWQEIDNPDGENNVLSNLAAAALKQGDFDAAQEFARQALAICRKIANRQGEGVNLCLLGYALAGMGQPNSARANLEAALEISLELRDRRYEALSRDGLGRVALHRREFEAAAAHFEKAASLSHETGERANEGESRLHLGQAMLRQGDFDTARAQLEHAQALAAEIGDPLKQAEVEAAWGELAYLDGHPERALEHGRRALESAARIGARALEAEALLAIAHAHEALRAWAHARDAYAEAAELLRALRLEFRQPEVLEGLARVTAALDAH
jgi:tetratricopeptide (TPR) repeat protein